MLLLELRCELALGRRVHLGNKACSCGITYEPGEPVFEVDAVVRGSLNDEAPRQHVSLVTNQYVGIKPKRSNTHKRNTTLFSRLAVTATIKQWRTHVTHTLRWMTYDAPVNYVDQFVQQLQLVPGIRGIHVCQPGFVQKELAGWTGCAAGRGRRLLIFVT